MTENFIGWGIPFPKILTPFVSGVECFGGAMLILGLFTQHPGRDAGGGHGRRHQVGEMGRRRFAGDAARLRGGGLFRRLHVARIAGPGAASLDRLLVNAGGHREIDLMAHIPVTAAKS